MIIVYDQTVVSTQTPSSHLKMWLCHENSCKLSDFQISDVKKIIDEFLRKSNLKKAQKWFPKNVYDTRSVLSC